MENCNLSWSCVQKYEGNVLKYNDLFLGSISEADEVIVTTAGDLSIYTVSFSAPCKLSAKAVGNLLIANYRYLEENTQFYIVEIEKHVDGTLSIKVDRAENELVTPISLDRMRKADGLRINTLNSSIFYICGLNEDDAKTRALNMYS